MKRYPPVLTKPDFVKRYKAGEFGNASPTFETRNDFLRGAVPGQLYHLRNREKGGETHYNLEQYELYQLWYDKMDESSWYASAMAPHNKGTIQGEIMQSERGGLYLHCVSARKPMRQAMKEEVNYHLEGTEASMVLAHYLCPNSREWLNVLLDRYPGHVIEFSSFSIAWGTLPNYNTVWWEVRNY